MSVVTPITEQPVTFEEAENERKFEALCNLIELSQGNFSLALVEFDLPSKCIEILGRLHKAFEGNRFKFADVVIAPPPLLTLRSLSMFWMKLTLR